MDVKSPEKHQCDKCDFICSKMGDWTRHISTNKHKKRTDVNLQIANLHHCELCDYVCSKNYEWSKHISTSKHILRTKIPEKNINLVDCIEHPFVCKICKSRFRAKSTYWNHKQKCISKPEIYTNELTTLQESPKIDPMVLIADLLKQNNDLQKQIIEMAKDVKPIIHNTTNNITNNSTNQTNQTNNQFNLGVFLNEDCKNAMSMNQFIESINLDIGDIEETGRLGFIDGISRIFINALKNLEITERPIHCTDYKRETIYIKDQDKWEKENTEKTNFVSALRQLEKKNMKLLPIWINENPNCRTMDTPEAKQYVKICMSSLGDPSREGIEKQDDKIIKNVLKEVIIDKVKK